jgi:predicted N-formylglutamate amidohydrolase
MTPPSNEHKPWHASVEKALRAAQDRGEPFTIESVLNGVGLFSWTLDREQAVVFANKLLAGSSAENASIERQNRKPYHGAVEQAVEMMTHRGESTRLRHEHLQELLNDPTGHRKRLAAESSPLNDAD